jgi:hypothetical protein
VTISVRTCKKQKCPGPFHTDKLTRYKYFTFQEIFLLFYLLQYD